MVLTIILVVLLAIVVYLLFVPILLVIDTRSNNYSIQLKGLLRASVKADEQEVLKIQIHLLAFKFNFYPLRIKKSKSTKKTKDAKKKSTKKQVKFKTIIRLLNSFRLKQFYLNLDTGDYITNAKLYPAFSFLNFYMGGFHINFTGQNTFVLVVENQPVRLLRSYINI